MRASWTASTEREAVDGRFPQHGKESRFRTSNGRLTVGMTWEEAQEEEAYGHMVEEILSSHKGEIIDELLESHSAEPRFLSMLWKSQRRDY